MCRLRDFAVVDLLEGVLALALGVDGVHEMHLGDCACMIVRLRWICLSVVCSGYWTSSWGSKISE